VWRQLAIISTPSDIGSAMRGIGAGILITRAFIDGSHYPSLLYFLGWGLLCAGHLYYHRLIKARDKGKDA